MARTLRCIDCGAPLLCAVKVEGGQPLFLLYCSREAPHTENSPEEAKRLKRAIRSLRGVLNKPRSK